MKTSSAHSRAASPEPSVPIRVLMPRLPTADAILPYLRSIDASRIYSNYGPLSREFARRLGEMTGAAGVTLTSNGTTAIEVALRASVPQGGGLCIMPAFTFIASAHAVCNAGLTPYLVEVDPKTLVLTPAIAEAALRSAPARLAAILVVSAFGAPPDLAGWAAFSKQYDIPVVFDAAAAVTAIEAVGAEPLCVSLHATKVLGIGEGGAILSSDPDFTARTTAMTGFGFLSTARISDLRGGNWRLSEYAAAIGLAALDALPQRLVALRGLAMQYRTLLEGKASRLQAGAGDRWATMTLNVILPEGEADATTARLDAARVEWRRWWGPGCHRHPAFADVPHTDLSVTDALAPRVLGVPFHDRLSPAEIERVVECLP